MENCKGVSCKSPELGERRYVSNIFQHICGQSAYLALAKLMAALWTQAGDEGQKLCALVRFLGNVLVHLKSRVNLHALPKTTWRLQAICQGSAQLKIWLI